MKYRILEDNMDRLTKKMTRIQNKCRKYGCDFIFEEVGEEFKEVEDESGNVFVWKTNKDVDEEYVINMKITGTVKEHSEFRDTKQTVITRCKIK